MKVYCGVCDKDATKNADVYENVDGFIFHCGDCNAPIVEISFEEMGIFAKTPKVEAQETEVEEDQPSLFTETDEKECEDCQECDMSGRRIPSLNLEDLEFIQMALTRKISNQVKALNKTQSTLSKIEDIMCECTCQ